MKTTPEHDERIAKMKFPSVYPHYITKVEKKGRTIEELEKNFSNKEVLDALGGEEYWKCNLPQKIHCSVLSEEAVPAPIEDYKLRKNNDSSRKMEI